MSELTVISDPIRCERKTYPLREGETLAHALMRLWPTGLDGGWRIYRDAVHEDNEIAALDLRYVSVLPGEVYLIVRSMAGQPTMILLAKNLFLALALAALTPKPRRIRRDDPDTISPNNIIAGQTNTLRPGARVPDILGRVRCYPDLLCNPVDVYNESNQTIGQMFVIGVGDYDYDEASVKLGDTPLSSIVGSDINVYKSGEEVPPFYVLKTSREVQEVSLLTGDTGAVVIKGDTDFVASSKQMKTQQPISVPKGQPIQITGTFFNNAVFWVDGVPPITQTAPPYIYTLDGPVADELGADAQFAAMTERISLTGKHVYYGNGVQFTWVDDDAIPDPPKQERIQFGYGYPGKELIPTVGDWLELRTKDGRVFRGRITLTSWPTGGRAAQWQLTMVDLNGNKIIFPSISGIDSSYTEFKPPDVVGGGGSADPDDMSNVPTNWYAAPLQYPDEIWVDIAFPQGLAYYDHGSRKTLTVSVRVDVRRKGQTDPERQFTYNFTYGTASAMRFTRRIDVRALGLGTNEYYEVRLQRVTGYYADNANNQYTQDSRWVRLAAAKQLVGQTYPHVTVASFSMSNTRSASAVSDMALNLIVTRILPTWTGSGWSAPAPTRKWADNFVQRCKSKDGANRADTELDLAGIYALQDQLDVGDAGDQGVISMTLDQMEDIDTELAAIADVARAVVYRVGRKLFVQRDQANPNALALFNARAKGPDGEQVTVRMTADADNDAVILQWIDEQLGWKQRDYQYPEDVVPVNPLRIGTACANWAQVRRRAVFEWNRLKYRRQDMTVQVTEDGRICRPGDVINVTDDVANLAQAAGEVIAVAGNLLTLDRDVTLEVGSSYLLMLRDLAGLQIDQVPASAGPQANQLQLPRSPAVRIKGRDSALGTLWALYRTSDAVVRPWLITGVQKSGPYVQLSAVNYSPKVYDGDSAPLPPLPPPLIP